MIIKSKSKSYQNKALSRPNLGPRLQTVRGEYCENATGMLPRVVGYFNKSRIRNVKCVNSLIL